MYISREMLPSKGAQRAATHHAAMHDKCKKKKHPKPSRPGWRKAGELAVGQMKPDSFYLCIWSRVEATTSVLLAPKDANMRQFHRFDVFYAIFTGEKLAPLTSNVKLTQLGEPQPRAETLTQVPREQENEPEHPAQQDPSQKCF